MASARVLILVLLIAASSAFGATTFFLNPNSNCPAPAVNPPFTLESSWAEVDGAVRTATDTTACGQGTQNIGSSKTNTANARQLVQQFTSKRLDSAQTISGTVKGTIRVQESATNDNIDQVSLKLLVVTQDGQTLRCTLLAQGDYGPTNEWATALTNRRIADGDTITTCSTAVEGDRIVIEVGFNNTTTGASVTGTQSYTSNIGTFCADNETGTSTCDPFLTFNDVTLTFKAEETFPPGILNNPLVSQ